MRMCYDNLIRLFGNLFWGMRFRTCEKFRAFADTKSSLTPEIFHKYKSHTAITSIVVALATNLKKLVIARKSVGCSWQSKKIAQPNLARFVVQKIGIKDAVVPSADFLLESGKRDTPPKSEKAAAFWRVGGAGRGVQPFLRKEKGDKKIRDLKVDLSAESHKEMDLKLALDSRDLDCHDSTTNLKQNFRHTERSEVSKSRESNQVQNAMTKERMGESHRFAQSKKIVADSQVAKMDSSRCRAQNDESFINYHESLRDSRNDRI